MNTALAVIQKEDQLKPKPKSFVVAVKVKTSHEWVHNGLRFDTDEEAASYARDLTLRWGAMVDYKIDPSDDLPNCTYPVPSDRYLVNRSAG